MRRRTFLLAPALTLPAVAARAQKPTTIGFLHGFSQAYIVPFARSVMQGLQEQGYVEGRNLTVIYRSSEGHVDRLAPLARELVELKVDAIFAAGGSDPARAARSVTSTVPIVFVSAADPVRAGLVPNLNRPGGNVTGVSLIGSALESKRVGLLHRLAPDGAPIAALIDPAYPDADLQRDEFKKAATAVKRALVIVEASNLADIEAAVAHAAEMKAGALAVAQGVFVNSFRPQVIAAIARERLPAIFNQREFADLGGLMSYGAHFADGYRQGGVYLGRILKGAPPAELPVMQPVRFEFVINTKTAKTLGLEIPVDMLAAADEVLE